MRILVTGSRSWTDIRTVVQALVDATVSVGDPAQITIVHGGALGADTIARDAALSAGMLTEVHLPDWRPYGIYNPQAGKLRNSQMVALGADICLAFIKDNSGGATDCAEKAEAAGIRTVRYVA